MEIPRSGAGSDENGVSRCWWCQDDPLYQRYDDLEWGRPVADDNQLLQRRAFLSDASIVRLVNDHASATIPAVKKAFAEKAWRFVSSASRRKIVLIPQMSDAARVFPRRSTR